MNKSSINDLNTLLKGEHMAIDTYEKIIQKVNNQNTKDQLQNIQQTHKMNASIISERIQDLGGHPAKGAGITGTVAKTMGNFKHMGNFDKTSYIKDMINGENMAIKAADKLISGDIDAESKQMVTNLVNDWNNNISTLNNLVSTSNNLQ